MVEVMKESGRTTKWMAKEYFHGAKEVNILERTSKTKKKAMENIIGQMGEAIKANGQMDFNKVKAYTLQKVVKKSLEFG